MRDKPEVKQYLLDTIKSKIPPRRMKMEGVIYRVLGFIPDDFEYEQGLVQLYLDQLGGYYDPEKDHFVMAAWLPAIMQVPVAVHELTHALQDQYFELSSFTDVNKYSSDELLARSALIEGDATAVMIDYSRLKVGQSPIAKDADVTAIMMQNLLGTSLFSGMNQIPESLKLTLLFPYTSGLRFAHTLLRKGDYQELTKAFAKPPRSTEEILHPEKYYIQKQDFLELENPKSKYAEQNREILFEDTLGEFSISALFAGFIKNKAEVAEIASGWGGDRIVVYQATDNSYELHWITHWDTESDSTAFYQAYKKVLESRAIGKDISISQNGNFVNISWEGI